MGKKGKVYVCERDCFINKPICVRVNRGFQIRTNKGCPPNFRPWMEQDGQAAPDLEDIDPTLKEKKEGPKITTFLIEGGHIRQAEVQNV